MGSIGGHTVLLHSIYLFMQVVIVAVATLSHPTGGFNVIHETGHYWLL